MALNLASPGIVVKEVDLTVGRVNPTSNKVGAIVAPFVKGPTDVPTLVENENGLLQIFGEPYATDKHYEHWLTASAYLAYGGSLQVIRSDDAKLKNGFAGEVGITSIKIKSLDDYNQLGYDENPITDVIVAARNPGSWSNGIKVAIIDAKADQILTGINTGTSVFSNVVSTSVSVGIGTTIFTGITTTSIAVGQYIQPVSGVIGSGTTVRSIGVGTVYLGTATLNSTSLTTTLNFGTYIVSGSIQVGYGITQSVTGRIDVGSGTTAPLDGYLKGIVTEVGSETISVKVLNHVSAGGTISGKEYQPLGTWAFTNSGSIGICTNIGGTTIANSNYTSQLDWFDQQKFIVGNTKTGTGTTEITIDWNSIADRPSTSEYAINRGSRFDEVHVVVIDALGTITGNVGTILEKHLSLSKAKDAEFAVGSPSYWRKYLANNSAYIFGGSGPNGITTTGYSSNFVLTTDNNWDQDANGITFGAYGANTLTLAGGLNYNGQSGITSTGALTSTLGDLTTGYQKFGNSEQYKVDFILMGSANYDLSTAQALANQIIAVAELRKDAVAFISPYRGAALSDATNENGALTVTVKSEESITSNVIQFYSPITSSSYVIFDSGYKYTYDRFSNTFRYIPLNGDIAGLCARNDINNFAWYSPAGTSRGAILNAVKLAYNPNKSQRDRLYSNRINPIIFSPGSGIILFGDKTGLGRSSAFDRINVRRLFIYIEQAISAAAKDQLFEFNDEITRTNFVNIVEPFLRDVQAKRGIYDYVVVCDQTNNTAAVIDSNEFVADIYIKPARSINYIGLTFVATRTGVAFEEVIGKF
jgi:hypothetical protein